MIARQVRKQIRGDRPPITVLIIDDSAVVRQAMTGLLSKAGPISVITASDPVFAEEKLRMRRPDVIVLDLEMPRMDGLTFLKRLMARDPIPVIICSGQAGPGTEAAFLAMSEGAVEIIAKPAIGVRDFFSDTAIQLVDCIYAAAHARTRGRGGASAREPSPPQSGPPGVLTNDQVIAIGASTGGTEAVGDILQAMPAGAPGMVIVQHMPEYFTRAFAQRLDGLCRIEVREAADGDRVQAGRALIAPGNRHLRLRRSGAGYSVSVEDGPLVSRHRPSVDVLFESVAEAAGRNAAGAILTGMGSDGARGLAKMRAAGARTLAQDEATSVVFGMPKEAIAAGAAELTVPLHRVARTLLEMAGARGLS